MGKATRRTRRAGVSAGQVQRSIVYYDHSRPHDTRSITVTLRPTEVIDERRAAGIVALRTGTALENVHIVRVST